MVSAETQTHGLAPAGLSDPSPRTEAVNEMYRLAEHDMDEDLTRQHAQALRDVRRERKPAGATLLTKQVARISRKNRVVELTSGEILQIRDSYDQEGRTCRDLTKATRAVVRCPQGVWFEIDMTKFQGGRA